MKPKAIVCLDYRIRTESDRDEKTQKKDRQLKIEQEIEKYCNMLG